ncbi:MAG TPA: cation-transporting P-type ATPase [Anaerolineaceae bacterium]|nr:cation-transporting P-type ATPase [Anaerolineaceae bacterium]
MNKLLGKHWQHLPPKEVIELLDSNIERGLDLFEVKHRQERFGLNALTPKKGKSPLMRFLMQFNNPLVIILVVASVVTAVLKDLTDALVIFGVVLINAVIGYIQESRAEQAIAALAKTMTTEAAVVRGGKVVRLSAVELVPGDIVQLQAGARVPADLRLVTSRDLQVTEAALTGESVPVEKDANLLIEPEAVLAERRNMAYASTLVTYGTATGVVVATGDGSEIGRISQLISSAVELETPLTRKISQFSRVLLVAILILSAVTFGVGVLRGQPVVDTLMGAIALAVGAIPEGLPAALTVTLAIGVSRMAKRRAIIRNLPAVETLGSTTVICSDKTGTLTQNQMTVQELKTTKGTYEISGVGYQPEGTISGNATEDAAVQEMLKAGVLCNDSQLVETDGYWTIQGDPTEGALLVSARKAGLSLETGDYPARLDSIPFDSQHQYMATLHADGMIYVKGAAEVLLERCNGAMDASGNVITCGSDVFRSALEQMAARGLRVLAFARLEKPGAKQITFEDITGLTLLGLQGMIDPPRPEVIDAIKASQRAGITVKMITGDHALTAKAIGEQIGLCKDGCSTVLTGADLLRLSDAELMERVDQVNVFARVAPEQKLRLVEALQARGHVVAMTGDGVNDAPALKQSNIGVAMGITGTDVSKEAADMVLTDDNFATIEAAIEEGRGVFDNLTKFISWALPTNLGEGLVLLAAIITGATLPILPIQILWINMITAAVLGIALSLEPKEPGIMERKPRNPKAPLLSKMVIWRIILVSIFILAGAFGLFEYELSRGASIEEARTVAVNVVIFVELLYLFNARSLTLSPFQLGFFSNPWAIGGSVLMILIQLLYTYAPFMNTIFGSAPIPFILWIDIIAVSLGAYLIVEIEKWLRRKFSR